ncbi:MAG: JAB domain-containing protein [Caldilineaceae bacterium]
MHRSEQYNPYQLAFDLRPRPEITYEMKPVEWSGGKTLGVFEMPEGYAQVRSPADVVWHLRETIYQDFDALDQEYLWTLLLNTKFYVTHHILVYKGNLNTTVVRIGELFKDALRFNASAMILTHNHPSGDARPSPEDIRVTELAAEAAKLLGVSLIDHIIMGKAGYTSLKEQGVRIEVQ